MMSYLWILLLGSLLAASAKAQDEVAPTEEPAAPGTPAPEADAAPEDKGEAAADEDKKPEEIPPTASAPEPAANDAAGESEPATPAAEVPEPVTPAADNAEPTPAKEEEQPAAPAQDVTEPTPPAKEEAEPATPAGDAAGDAAGAATPAAADAGEVAATTAAPAAEPEVPKSEEPTEKGAEEAVSTAAPPAPEEKVPEATAGVPDVADNEEKPTDPAADAQPTKPAEDEKVEEPAIKVDHAPEVKADGGLDLADALPNDNQPKNPGQSRGTFVSDPHAEGAIGNADQPKSEEAASSPVAGILIAIGVAVVGAIVGYFTYKKKKLCFSNRQEADPEAARKANTAEAQSDPQVLSNLLNSS